MSALTSNLAVHNKKNGLDLLVAGLCSCFNVGIFWGGSINYSEKDSKLLKFLVDEGYTERSVVEKYAHDHIIFLAERMLQQHLRTREFPDHLGSEAVFGYGLRHGKIHPKDVTFDHGEIAGEYIVASDGLLESVVDQLLTYKDPEPHSWPTNIDTCCTGCCC